MTAPQRPIRPGDRRPVRPPRPDRGPIPQATFIAPSFRETGWSDEEDNRPPRGPRNDGKGLRMTKSAQEAARRAGLDDEAVRRVMSEPNQVAADRDNPDRTRFTRGQIVVVTAKDGVVLGVYKR